MSIDIDWLVNSFYLTIINIYYFHFYQLSYILLVINGYCNEIFPLIFFTLRNILFCDRDVDGLIC